MAVAVAGAQTSILCKHLVRQLNVSKSNRNWRFAFITLEICLRKASSLPRPLESSVRITPASQLVYGQRKADIACKWMMDEVIIRDFRIYSAYAFVRRRHGFRTSYPCLLDAVDFRFVTIARRDLSPVRYGNQFQWQLTNDEATMQRLHMPPILPPAAILFNIYSLHSLRLIDLRIITFKMYSYWIRSAT